MCTFPRAFTSGIAPDTGELCPVISYLTQRLAISKLISFPCAWLWRLVRLLWNSTQQSETNRIPPDFLFHKKFEQEFEFVVRVNCFTPRTKDGVTEYGKTIGSAWGTTDTSLALNEVWSVLTRFCSDRHCPSMWGSSSQREPMRQTIGANNTKEEEASV